MALIRSMRTCVGCAGSTYDRFILGLFSLFAMLLSRFLRSSNILKDIQSVSSIFSLWPVAKAVAVNECPV